VNHAAGKNYHFSMIANARANNMARMIINSVAVPGLKQWMRMPPGRRINSFSSFDLWVLSFICILFIWMRSQDITI
jgi:hypothetical protein